MEKEQKELQDADGLPEDPATRPKEKPVPVPSYSISDLEALDRAAERMRADAAIEAAKQDPQAILSKLAEQAEQGRSGTDPYALVQDDLRKAAAAKADAERADEKRRKPTEKRRRKATAKSSRNAGSRQRRGESTQPSRAELAAALHAATTADEIVAAVARLYWPPGSKKKCPIPTWSDLVHRNDPIVETDRDLSVVLGADAYWEPWPWPPSSPSDMLATYPVAVDKLLPLLEVTEVHQLWMELPVPRPPHPLRGVVSSWLERVIPDRRPKTILPQSFRGARYEKVSGDQLPFSLDLTTPLGAQQDYLPGLEPAPSVLVPVLPLRLYDLAAHHHSDVRDVAYKDGAPKSRRGAPIAQRMFFEILMSVDRLDRVPGRTVRLEVTYRELMAWIWPSLLERRWNFDHHLLLSILPALLELDAMRIEWQRQLWRLVSVLTLPTAATRFDDVAVFRVELLPGSEHGPMIDRLALRQWGVVSVVAWRVLLRLAYLWDLAKRRNNGARVYATRPQVWRGRGGVPLGADGEPLLTADGSFVKDWSDPRAVLLGADGKPALIRAPDESAAADKPRMIADPGAQPVYERNPAADRVPELGPDDQIRLGYDDNLDELSSGTRRKRLHDSRKTFRRIESEGQMVIEQSGAGMRLLEPRPAELAAGTRASVVTR